MTTEFSVSEFGAVWQQFMERVNAQTPPSVPALPSLADLIQEFLGADPTSMALLKEKFLERDLPNIQLAFDHYLAAPGRSAQQLGYSLRHEQPNFGLGMVLSFRNQWEIVTEGPVAYRSVELADGARLRCMEKGLYFIQAADQKMVVLLRGAEPMWGRSDIGLEVLCSDTAWAESFMAEMRRLIHQHNVYRGHIISLGAAGADDIRFHHLPPIEREAIILPARLLETIERNTLSFAEHLPRLRAAGRHIKRGLLFHGPPGTGKTFTLFYLASQMRGRTVILLTGRILGLIKQSCELARLLAPATVVLEDVDLVAEERTQNEAGPLLFELLNEMDGLAPDTDVLFILSTNRPDILEPALAARPGRIDQAIEFPLPDAECRRRLFHLYGRGLTLPVDHLERMVQRTEGTSPAFIRELLRKAALVAAEQNRDAPATEPLSLSDAHLREALFSIVTEGGNLTKTLLGVAPGALEP